MNMVAIRTFLRNGEKLKPGSPYEASDQLAREDERRGLGRPADGSSLQQKAAPPVANKMRQAPENRQGKVSTGPERTSSASPPAPASPPQTSTPSTDGAPPPQPSWLKAATKRGKDKTGGSS